MSTLKHYEIVPFLSPPRHETDPSMEEDMDEEDQEVLDDSEDQEEMLDDLEVISPDPVPTDPASRPGSGPDPAAVGASEVEEPGKEPEPACQSCHRLDRAARDLLQGDRGHQGGPQEDPEEDGPRVTTMYAGVKMTGSQPTFHQTRSTGTS